MTRRSSRTFRRFLLTALLALLCLGPGPGPGLSAASDPAAGRKAEVLERVREASRGIVSIESGFVQESRSSMLEEPLRSRGRFEYRAPDRLLWEVVSPERFGFSVDGDRVTSWKGRGEDREGAPPGAGEGIRQFAGQLFAWVRADFAWLEERFAISVESESPVVLELEPLSGEAAERLDRIRVTFAGDLEHVETIEIRETGGDRTVVTFEDTRVVKDKGT